MPILQIDIPNDKATVITEAFAEEFGWSADLGITKAAFVKYQLIQYIKQVTRNNLGNKDAGAARTAKEAEINSIAIT